MSVELVDADRQLPIAYRNTIANMMAEAEALNGIFAADEITDSLVRTAQGRRSCRIRASRPAPTRATRSTRTLSLSDVTPMIAKPFSPGNAFPAEEVARERIEFDKALIGSCTNGSYDDLLQAALVIRHARAQGVARTARPFLIFPGSGGVARQIERPDPRLGGESIAAVFRAVGGEIRQSWCGPCFGQGPDALRPGQRAITSFNRNWQNRMGVGRRRLPRQPRRRRRLGARRLHGAAIGAGPRVGSGGVRHLNPRDLTQETRRSEDTHTGGKEVRRGLQILAAEMQTL